jgi:two-component system, OmpR family, phosphate regulon sensor histidine kinase PhoR
VAGRSEAFSAPADLPMSGDDDRAREARTGRAAWSAPAGPAVSRSGGGVSRRPVSCQLRALVTAVCVFMLLACAATVYSLIVQSASVNQLTNVIGPARDVAADVLQVMADADNALSTAQVTQDVQPRESVSAARERVDEARHLARRLLAHHSLDERDRQLYRRLQDRHDDAVGAWWTFAHDAFARAAAGLPSDAARREELFDRFRTEHTALNDRLVADRNALRVATREVVPEATLVTLAATALVLAGVMLVARRVARSLTAPIAGLREVVQRIEAGDLSARADERAGAREVRDLAAAFNTLAAEQAETLRLHEAALEVEQTVPDVASVRDAIEVACAEIGPALDADRVVISLVDGGGEVVRAAQWHVDGLPDFPPDVSPYTGPVAEELWRRASHVAVADVRAECTGDERWIVPFRHEADTRALLVVPIGLAERPLGTIAVTDGTRPRNWRSAQIALVHHVAVALAHGIAEADYREQQAQHVARLERLDRQKDDFLSTVSHELRTPLASITGYLELLLDGDAGEVAPPQRAMLEVVDRNAVRLRALVEDLLAMNQAEAGHARPDRPVELARVVAETVDELRPLADRNGVRMVLDDDADPGWVLGDREHLGRAVTNVVANAIKFTPRLGEVRVSRFTDPVTGEVVLTCADTGIGIPRADLPHLTRQFFRAGNVAGAATPGTGLGLAIVRAVVDAHAGTLSIDSTEGRGTVVTLRFPARAVGAEAAPEPERSEVHST